jgi:glycosyltransferase involved in cell wall biosynthesis
MRVLVLSDLFPPVAFGGYELECAALVDRLRERHEVLVLTTTLDRRRAPGEPGVRRALPARPSTAARATLLAPVHAVVAARTVRRALAEFAPDVVYVSNGAAMPQAAIAVAATHGVPVVCRFSELWFAREFLRGDRFLRHLHPGQTGLLAAWGRVARPVNRHPALRLDAGARFPATISWASRAMRAAAGVPPSIDAVAERVIYPATARHDVFRAVRRAPAVPPTLAYVGRVTTAKGAEVALEALAVLRDAHGVDARLVYAGACAPEMRARLEALARERGIGAHVDVRGSLPTDDLAAVMAASAVVLMPSVVAEAFGLVAIEAALAHTPVIASDLGGIPEALEDEEHALLVTPGDPAALAAAVDRVLADPAGTAARVERAFDRAQRFTLTAYQDQSEELIADAAR